MKNYCWVRMHHMHTHVCTYDVFFFLSPSIAVGFELNTYDNLWYDVQCIAFYMFSGCVSVSVSYAINIYKLI